MIRAKKRQRVEWRIGLFLVLWLMALRPDACPAGEPNLVMQEISYTSSDNITISGSWITRQPVDGKKKSRKRAPLVLLLHDYGFNRREWGMFIPELVEQGYQVLAIDVQNAREIPSGGASSGSVLTSGVGSVQSALEWIRRQKTIDRKRIGVIGVGLGANIAYICSGKFPKKIKTTVIISPSHEVIIDGSFSGLHPRSILFCVSAKSHHGGEMFTAETLSNFTSEPKKVIVFNSAARGMALFYKHPEIKQEILRWLEL